MERGLPLKVLSTTRDGPFGEESGLGFVGTGVRVVLAAKSRTKGSARMTGYRRGAESV